jgi:hypothetical protein
LLNVIDDCTRECLAIEADTSLPGARVIEVLERLADLRGLPRSIVADNGPEFAGRAEVIRALAVAERVHALGEQQSAQDPDAYFLGARGLPSESIDAIPAEGPAPPTQQGLSRARNPDRCLLSQHHHAPRELFAPGLHAHEVDAGV